MSTLTLKTVNAVITLKSQSGRPEPLTVVSFLRLTDSRTEIVPATFWMEPLLSLMMAVLRSLMTLLASRRELFLQATSKMSLLSSRQRTGRTRNEPVKRLRWKLLHLVKNLNRTYSVSKLCVLPPPLLPKVTIEDISLRF